MATPRVLIVRAAGTNCDGETEFAWHLAGATADRVHVNALLADPHRLEQYQIVTLPGGFSYGDDIASGKVLATQIASRLGEPLRGVVDRGGLLLGICNGFQVLVKAGLLPGPGLPAATLTHNDTGRFESRWVHLRAERSACPLFEPGERLFLPIAHGEGRLVLERTANDPTGRSALAALETAGCVAARYVRAENEPDALRHNPNGSEFDLAAICDATGRIFGLMPHPERNLLPEHRPDWTRSRSVENDGLRFFRRAVGLYR